MSDECTFEDLPDQHTAHIRAHTPVSGLPVVLGQSYGQIAAVIEQEGLQITGAPYTAYFNLDMDDLDVEIGFPVNSTFEDRDQVKSGKIPAGRYAALMHRGPYSAMEPAYQKLTEWIGKQGAAPSGVAYEFYFNSPDEVPESELLTKILFPVIAG